MKASLDHLATSSSNTFLALGSLTAGPSRQTQANPSYALPDAGEQQEKCPPPPPACCPPSVQLAASAARAHCCSALGSAAVPRLPPAPGGDGQRGAEGHQALSEQPTSTERVSDHPHPKAGVPGGAQLAASLAGRRRLMPQLLSILCGRSGCLPQFCTILGNPAASRSRASCNPSCGEKKLC